MRRLAFVLVLSALTLCAQAPTGAGPNLYSQEKESALGAQLAQAVQRNVTPVNNPAALAYVQQAGARIAAQMPSRFSFTFALIGAIGSRATRGEPIALPGGFIFIPANLFLTAHDDAEFAGALAHAMAHVAARHGTRQATKGTLDQLMTVPLIFNGGDAGLGGRQPSAVVPIAFMNFSNAYEQEADMLAITAVSAAGYDPEGLVRYLSRQLPDGSPDKTARIGAMQTEIERLQSPASDEFLRIQTQLQTQQN